MINLITVGKRIATLRKQYNMTQNDLAESLFVTHQAISKWENGKSIPNLDILYELTKLFNTTIDFLLDDDTIEEQNYEMMFASSTREAVINHFLNQDDLNKEIHQFFYLLNSKERKMIINQMIHGVLKLDVDAVWPYLSIQERHYILSTILSGKLDYNLNLIKEKLTNEERLMIKYAIDNSHYQYPMIYHS